MGFPSGGWAGASAQPSSAQLPAYMPYNSPAAVAGAMRQGSQPYMAMSIAAQPAAYDAASLYSGAGSYTGVAGAAPSPSWSQQPADYAAAGSGNSSSVHGIGGINGMYGPAAAGLVGGAYSTHTAGWSPAAVAAPGVPAAGAGAATAAAAAKSKKDAYRAELEQQIRDKAARKAAEKSARDAEEARKEAEVAGYNPWGRAGAGAPLRDAAGQVGLAACCL